MSTAVVLFSRDLRVSDNPALSAAVRDFNQVLPLFVFDPRLLAGGQSSPNRLAFLLDCLADLDRSLGGGLITRTGDPAAEALRLAAGSRGSSRAGPPPASGSGRIPVLP